MGKIKLSLLKTRDGPQQRLNEIGKRSNMLSPPQTSAPKLRGYLLDLRRLESQTGVPAVKQEQILRDITQLALKHLGGAGYTPVDFATSSFRQFAEVFVDMLRRMKFSVRSLKYLREKKKYLVDHYAAEFFELVGKNLHNFHQGEEIARFRMEAVNAFKVALRVSIARKGVVLTGREARTWPIVNARGEPVVLSPVPSDKIDLTFKIAVDIKTNRYEGNRSIAVDTTLDKGIKKFIDMGHVSEFKVRGIEYCVVHLPIELKLSGAAKSFPIQMAARARRYREADFVRMTINGKEKAYPPERIIFLRDSIAVAVKPSRTKSFKLVPLGKAGDYYLIGAEVRMEPFKQFFGDAISRYR